MKCIAKKIIAYILPGVVCPTKRASFLDIGFGYGGHAGQPLNITKAVANGWDVYGIDKSRWSVAYIRKKYRYYPRLSLLRKDIRAGLVFEGWSFDLVTFNDILDFFWDEVPSELDRSRYDLFRECRRVLKTRGLLVLEDHTLGAFEFDFADNPSKSRSIAFYERWEKSLDILSIAEKAGLQVVYADKRTGRYAFRKI